MCGLVWSGPAGRRAAGGAPGGGDYSEVDRGVVAGFAGPIDGILGSVGGNGKFLAERKTIAHYVNSVAIVVVIVRPRTQ